VLVGTTIAYSYLERLISTHASAAADDRYVGAWVPATQFSAYEHGATWVDAFWAPVTRVFAITPASEQVSQTWVAFGVRALLALLVALALQIAVNYANDYSDGIRGTDDARVGPVRLVGQGLAPAHRVREAALASFAVAALAGLGLVLLTQTWWLVLVGLAAIAAAWLYTGGPRPYGYAGLGELFVFVFFGLVAVAGSTYVQTLTVTWVSIAGGIACGMLSVAILLANNLRDIPTDSIAGKRTLAVRLGDRGTRMAYLLAVAAPFVVTVAIAVPDYPWALLALVAIPLAVPPLRVVSRGATGRDLVPVLSGTGRLLLGYAVALSLGLVIATLTR
jgi:1,4-dihydroxy-2-naphthoate octaprenyltransferase